MTLLAPLADPLPAVERPEVWWRANHTGGRFFPVEGGWPTVRTLVGALDGDGWPFTTFQRDFEFASVFAQVLGTAERMLTEVHQLDGPGFTVFRKGFGSAHWVAMTVECGFWVGAIRSDEILNADEASQVVINWLRDGSLDARWGLRPTHPSAHRK